MYRTPSRTFGSTNASIRTVPTASKKFGLSGLAIEFPRLTDFADTFGRYDEPFVEEPPRRCVDPVEDGTALDEKLRKLLSG